MQQEKDDDVGGTGDERGDQDDHEVDTQNSEVIQKDCAEYDPRRKFD